MNGYIEINIGGKKRPLKFGINQTAMLCEQLGITMKEMNEMFAPKKMEALDITGGEVRDLLWSGLKAGALFKGIDDDFDNIKVGFWLDDLDPGEMLKALEAMGGGNPQDEKKKKPKVA